MNRIAQAACSLLIGIGLSSNAAAQIYPTKAVSMVIPFPAGGAVDIVCRTGGSTPATPAISTPTGT